MVKYLIGLGALVVVVVGYLLLVQEESTPVTAPELAVPEPSPVAVPAAVPEAVAPLAPDEDALLEDIAADIREDLPQAVTETLALNDAVFLPRMRIMDFRYVMTTPGTIPVASDMRALIDARVETICREGREMFRLDVTLRNSFEDREGNLFQRIYLLPEECQQFF